ncbi:hypothetical protein HY642_05870, partial [Candidatus Woesearchaeota archaeon]|nr:hypothetical protein [Candidatus Woesearchaeota archaeon]
IKGRTNRVSNTANLALGTTSDGLVMAGPVAAIGKHCAKSVEIVQGNDKPSDVAKQVAKMLGAEIDDVLRVLPAGNSKIKRQA